ncbi:MAG: hypothetical protein LUG60_05590 [Erysipelotrichaceae bacterium]|nr:hypothetical protein [Erysipelotrichaceae bacterium]
MFYTGHLILINKAKKQCEYLIVGIDTLMEIYKH